MCSSLASPLTNADNLVTLYCIGSGRLETKPRRRHFNFQMVLFDSASFHMKHVRGYSTSQLQTSARCTVTRMAARRESAKEAAAAIKGGQAKATCVCVSERLSNNAGHMDGILVYESIQWDSFGCFASWPSWLACLLLLRLSCIIWVQGAVSEACWIFHGRS